VGEVAGRRMTAEIEGDFVVFLIGARLSKLQLVQGFMDLGGRRGMRHMLDYLVARPEKGLLAYEMGLPTIVQYWRSFEQLEAFAKDKDDPHLDIWRQYWRRVGRSSRTGIWHETFLVRAGQYEAVYGNMPPHGLGKAGRLVPVSESSSARERLGAVPVGPLARPRICTPEATLPPGSGFCRRPRRGPPSALARTPDTEFVT
jgi:hypothetical protein